MICIVLAIRQCVANVDHSQSFWKQKTTLRHGVCLPYENVQNELHSHCCVALIAHEHLPPRKQITKGGKQPNLLDNKAGYWDNSRLLDCISLLDCSSFNVDHSQTSPESRKPRESSLHIIYIYIYCSSGIHTIPPTSAAPG